MHSSIAEVQKVQVERSKKRDENVLVPHTVGVQVERSKKRDENVLVPHTVGDAKMRSYPKTT